MKVREASVLGQKNKTGLPVFGLSRTRWSDAAEKGETLREYPRPAMVRNAWICLNGRWEYAFVPVSEGENEPESYQGEILVPFSPESPLSGVCRQLQPEEYLWYRLEVEVPELKNGYHYLLHFGAVDQSCQVYINGRCLAKHEGGYLPFTIDLNKVPARFTLSVRVRDLSDTSYHSRGKQKLGRGGMYYTAQSGIWQTVWMEPVPYQYISEVTVHPDPDRKRCYLEAVIREPGKNRIHKIMHETIEHKQVHFWSPEDPYLYHYTMTFGDDLVTGYYAMRTIEIKKAPDGYMRFYLNHKLCNQTGVLDQGYWCDGLMTAPSDEAMIYDIQTMKDLGFNMIRKHIKIEPQRWYFHCDRLGMLVWQDMVNGGNAYKDWLVTYLQTLLNARNISMSDGSLSYGLLSRRSKEGRKEFLRETWETMSLLSVHPCIITWVPFNEGWGQFKAKKLAGLMKKKDPTRLVDHASGWYDQKAGDIKSHHHYFFKLRYKAEKNRVLALSEYGGYTLQIPDHTFSEALYGYGKFKTQQELTDAVKMLFETEVRQTLRDGFSAYVYTQLSDIEDEANGILTYDRELIKMDPETLKALNALVTAQGEE